MIIDRGTRYRRTQGGFTLIEAVLAMVLLSMAAAGVLLPAVSGASVQAEGLHRTLAAVLANDAIERIVAMPFDDIVVNPEDYYSEDQGQLKDASENPLTDSDSMYANFSREVKCEYVRVPQQDDTVTPNFIRVTVSVSYRGQQLVSVNRLISK